MSNFLTGNVNTTDDFLKALDMMTKAFTNGDLERKLRLELAEVTDKRQKLSEFLLSSDSSELSKRAHDLLYTQGNILSDYARVLDARIDELTTAGYDEDEDDDEELQQHEPTMDEALANFKSATDTLESFIKTEDGQPDIEKVIELLSKLANIKNNEEPVVDYKDYDKQHDSEVNGVHYLSDKDTETTLSALEKYLRG